VALQDGQERNSDAQRRRRKSVLRQRNQFRVTRSRASSSGNLAEGASRGIFGLVRLPRIAPFNADVFFVLR
jgi:hypothetical protein